MAQAHNILLYIHILIGFASLVLFWIPIAAKKGSPLHIRGGPLVCQRHVYRVRYRLCHVGHGFGPSYWR